MATARRRAMRSHACQQAMIVWLLLEKGLDAAEFIERGSLAAQKSVPMNPELRANVDKYIDQYMTTGRIVVDG